MSERLATLLREAADAPEPLQLQHIEQRVRRDRRRRTALAAVAVAAVAAAVVVPVTAIPVHHGQAAVTAAPPPTAVSRTVPVPALAGRPVSYRQVVVVVPPGWTVGQPGCAIPDDSVSLGPAFTGGCPYMPDGPNGISVVFFDDNAETTPASTSSRWAGQPAREQVTSHNVQTLSGRTFTVTDDTVDLPLLGARVTAQAPTPAAAAQLLKRVTVRPAASIDLPLTASSLGVSVVATSRPSFEPDVSTRDEAAIQSVLSSLRAAPALPVSTPLCDADAARAVALLTIGGLPQIQVRLGYGCDEVIAGNGTLARATPQLKAALAAIVGADSLD